MPAPADQDAAEGEALLRVAGVVNDSIVDGPGLRLAVFLQGCDKRCPGCHNPETQQMTGGDLISVSSLFDMVKRNPLLSGVTLSGGEPLLQARALTGFARLVKAAGLNVFVYTGDVLEEILEKGDPDVLALLALTDVLVDGPFLLAEKSLAIPFRGSRNQRILDMPASLAEGRAVAVRDPSWG
jgi:anaerobic ribonucleoside-triphosphate reductase activating protein